MAKNTRQQQKVRAQKRAKREKKASGRRTRPQESDLAREARELLALRPELAGLRFPAAKVRSQLERLDELATQLLSGELELENLPGPYDLRVLRGDLVSALADDNLAQLAVTALRGLGVGGRRAGARDLLLAGALGHLGGEGAVGNPLWEALLDRSLRDPELGPQLALRSRWLDEDVPFVAELVLPGRALLQDMTGASAEQMEALDRIDKELMQAGQLDVGVHFLYPMLQAEAKLLVLARGLDPDERVRLYARLNLAWARSAPPELLDSLAGPVPSLGEASELGLAWLGRQLNFQRLLPDWIWPRFGVDPDSPEPALDLAHDLSEHQGRVEEAIGILQWVTGKYPELFEAHLELARLWSLGGEREKAQQSARRCLTELHRLPPDTVPAEGIKTVEEQVRAILAGSPLAGTGCSGAHHDHGAARA
ncbi:MAG: hypothetical protein AMXMBFR33_12740 [Candidatus Xenobia bacterium]